MLYKHTTECGLLTFNNEQKENTELLIEPGYNEKDTNVIIELESKDGDIYVFKGDIESIHPMFEWDIKLFDMICKNKPCTIKMGENVSIIYEIKVGIIPIKVSIKLELDPENGDLSKKMKKMNRQMNIKMEKMNLKMEKMNLKMEKMNQQMNRQMNLKMEKMESIIKPLVYYNLQHTIVKPDQFLRLADFINNDLSDIVLHPFLSGADCNVNSLKKLVEKGYKFPHKPNLPCHLFIIRNVNIPLPDHLISIELVLNNSDGLEPKHINMDKLEKSIPRQRNANTEKTQKILECVKKCINNLSNK
jgi:hypothetical protein